jgi:hypothetical protein
MAVECSVGPILIAGEYRSQTFTYSAEDICGNPVSESAVYTWYLQDPPILLNVPDGGNLGCNASGPPVVTAVEAYDDDGNPLTVTAEPGLISQDLCNVTQSMIYSATDDCNSTTSQAVTYTWKIDETPPDLFNVPDDIDVLCGEPFEILLPDALDYCDGAVTVLFERSDGGDWDDPYVAGTTTQISFWAMDECLNKSDTVTIDLTIESCGDEYCTLTQGAYGSEGGYYCDGSSTEYLIDSLLAEGDLVLGYNNNTMTFHPGDAVCVMNLLPGGGPAKKINGSNDCTGYGGIQIKLGRINNVLLAQLITLGLNLRLSPDLAYLPIYSDTLWTIASVGCGEPNDTVAGTGQRYILPYPVYMLLSENGTIIPTVEDLYNLANLGLGGEPVGVSLADLAFAADVINVGFDECRFGYFIEVPLEQRSPATPVDVTKMDQVKFNIYPNPFNTEANISFSVPESGQVSVDIYTLTGVRIQTLFNRNAEAGMVYLTKFSGQTGTNQGTYICVISTEYGTKYQRVMMIR